MAKQKDVFGFDELEKAVERMGKNYETEADRFLNAMASQAAKRMRQVTPVKTGKLKKSYGTQKPRQYNDKNRSLVSRVRNRAPHAHLYELGREVYSSKKKVGKVNKYSSFGKKVKGISHYGRVEGRFLFKKVWKEFDRRFGSEAKKLLDKVTKELQVK